MSKLKSKTTASGIKDTTIWGPSEVYRLMTGKEFRIHTQKNEIAYLVCMDSDNHAKKVFELKQGTPMYVAVSVFDIIRAAALCDSHRIILVHNHPNSSSKPSSTDMKFTLRLKIACHFCGITLLDHVIIGDKSCSSIARLLNPKVNLALFMKVKEIMSLRQSIIYYWLNFWCKS